MKKNAIDYALVALAVLIAIGTAVYVGLSWESIPDTIPLHYGAGGEVTEYGKKSDIWLLVGIDIVMVLLVDVISWFPSLWNLPAKTPKNFMISKYMIEAMGLIIALFLGSMIVISARGIEAPMGLFIGFVVVIIMVTVVPLLFMDKK